MCWYSRNSRLRSLRLVYGASALGQVICEVCKDLYKKCSNPGIPTSAVDSNSVHTTDRCFVVSKQRATDRHEIVALIHTDAVVLLLESR